MTLFPVINRELRVALRKKETRKSRFWYAAIAVSISALCLLLFAHSGKASLGLRVHRWLFFLGFYVAAATPIQLIAGLFAQDRQNNTFGLLFLAGISPAELFGGKVLSAFLVTAMNLLALTPALAIPFLTGGVSLSLFLATLFCLPVVLLFTLSVVCLASAVLDEESTARVGAAIGAAMLCLMPFAIHELCSRAAHPISSSWLLLSPAWGPWMVEGQLMTTTLNRIWLNCAITLLWSCAFFVLAAVALRRSWKQELSGTATQSGAVLSWLQNATEWRRKHARWLDINSCAWMAMRDRQPLRVAWAMMAMLFVSLTLSFGLMPAGWIKVWMLLAIAIAIIWALDWILAHTAAKRLADARRSSAMELILTTPVEVREIIDGHMLALDYQFRPLFRTAFFLNLSIMFAGLSIRTWDWRSLCVCLIVWCFLLFQAWRRGWPQTFKNSIKPMWAGFNTGLPGLAVSKSSGPKWYNFVTIYFAFLGTTVQRFPTGSRGEFVFFAMVAVIAVLIMLLRWLFKRFELTNEPKDPIETMLESEFRLIAAEPLPDPKDPRLKKWIVNKPLYHYRRSLVVPTE